MRLSVTRPAPDRRVVLVSLAVVLAILGLTSCGSGDDGTSAGEGGSSGAESGEFTEITRAQWEAVTVESTKEQVLDDLGKPQFENATEGLTDSIAYPTTSADVQAQFSFDPDDEGGGFQGKVWSETTRSKVRITAAQFARVRVGMTEQEVERILGEPFARQDEVSTSELATGKNPPGTLQHCIWYSWSPDSTYAASVCFDPSGRVNEVEHATAS